jgi:hypothetical protein
MDAQGVTGESNVDRYVALCFHLTSDTCAAALSKDDLVCLLFHSTRVADQAMSLLRAQQPCPGPYWRSWPAVRERIDEHNNDNSTTKRKRRRIDDKTCVVRERSFTSGFLGPRTRVQICNACGQTLKRDKKKGFLLDDDDEARLY